MLRTLQEGDRATLFFNPHRPRNISSIFQEGFTEKTADFETWEIFNSSKIGSNQNRISQSHCVEVGSLKIDSTQIRISQIAKGKICTLAISSTQIDSTQISMAKIGVSQVDTKHSRPTQISSTQIDVTHINPNQTRIAQVDISQIESRQNSRTNLNSSEIFLPSLILSEKMPHAYIPYFALHNNSTLQIIDSMQFSATQIWQNLLNPSTPIDINFQITDLTKGQLAEAQITNFAHNGQPDAGTILIGYNANGIGWFIGSEALLQADRTSEEISLPN